MRKIGRAVIAVACVSVLCSLFGCAKAPSCTTENIRSLSISCAHMDFSYSYSFYLRKTENVWLLDAEFAVDTEQPRVEYEACPVAEVDVRELLDIVQEQGLIEKLWRYKKPRIKAQALDETAYYTSLLFSDGEQLSAATRLSQDLESCFYRLAENNTPTASGAGE